MSTCAECRFARQSNPSANTLECSRIPNDVARLFEDRPAVIDGGLCRTATLIVLPTFGCNLWEEP